jgi:hypothetical protein
LRKSILYCVFGLGKVFRRERAKLEAEGIVLIDEGIPASMTLYKFRGMGSYASWRKSLFPGALVLTKSRLFGNSFSRVVLNIPLSDEHIRKIAVSVNKKGHLDIVFSASDFMPATGKIRLTFKTPQAGLFLDALQPFLKPPDSPEAGHRY